MKAQYHKNIIELVNNVHCEVVGDSKWKVIGEIRYENMEGYYGSGICDFSFNGPDIIDRIELVKLTQYLWGEHWC